MMKVHELLNVIEERLDEDLQVEKRPNKPEWVVKLNKKVVGNIELENGKYSYRPKGGRAGEEFDSLTAVIKSLKEGLDEAQKPSAKRLLQAFGDEYGDLDEDDRGVRPALKAFLKKKGHEDMLDKVVDELIRIQSEDY